MNPPKQSSSRIRIQCKEEKEIDRLKHGHNGKDKIFWYSLYKPVFLVHVVNIANFKVMLDVVELSSTLCN